MINSFFSVESLACLRIVYYPIKKVVATLDIKISNIFLTETL